MNSKQKGNRGEREAARELARILNCEARRGVQYCGDQEAPDVKTSIVGLHVEVKRVERLNIESAMQQARGDCGEGQVPVVLHRKNNREWLITHRLEDWPRVAEQIFLTLAENPK